MAILSGEVACPHAITCGACTLIHLPYEEQLARKTARVTAAVRRFASLAAVKVMPTEPAEPVIGYRTRSKLVVGPGGVGLFHPRSHRLVDLPECQVAAPPIAMAIERVRRAVRERAVPIHVDPEDGVASTGLRAIDVRGTADANAVLLTLVTDADGPARSAVEAFGRVLIAEKSVVAGVFVSLHTHGQPRLLGGEAIHVAGRERLDDTLGATRYVAGPGAFVQAHRGQSYRIHALVAGHLPSVNGRVLDVYGGGGGIGVALAARGASVTLVESYAPAVSDASASAKLNGVGLDVMVADAGAALSELAARRENFDLVVVNPPRRGCDLAVRRAIAALAPPRLAYVSCDPETLARDLDQLAVYGYVAESVTSLDMIPLTAEVECVVLLERRSPPSPHTLWQGDDLLAVDKPGGEPADPRPEIPGSLRSRVRTDRAWDDARPLLAPDEGASGVAIFVRGGESARVWDDVVRSDGVRTTWTVLVRGVAGARGTIRRSLPGVPESGLTYRRVEVVGGHGLLEVTMSGCSATAVRRLLASGGHPVAGDGRYGHAPTNRHLLERDTLMRTFLHLSRVEITDPHEGTTRVVTSELAEDLRLVLDRLRG